MQKRGKGIVGEKKKNGRREQADENRKEENDVKGV